MPRNDINIYLRAEAREALTQLTERWGVSRQEAIVRALLMAQETRGIEYGVSCSRVAYCDRPRGHEGEHGAWVVARKLADALETWRAQ